MTALRLACVLLALDALIGFAAVAGWPRWAWLHRAVDRCEVEADGLRERQGVRA